MAGLAHEGEGRSGDLAVFAPSERGGLVAVIDGLGHGDAAADAAEAAAEILHERGRRSRRSSCSSAATRSSGSTRGAVMTLAWFDLEARTMAWTGVGNVEARFMRAGDGPDARYDSPVVLGGVVGYNLPQVRDGDDRARAGRRGRARDRRRRRRLLGRRSSRGPGPAARRARCSRGTARAPTTRWPSSSGTSGRRRDPSNVNCGWVGRRGSRPRSAVPWRVFARYTGQRKTPGTPAQADSPASLPSRS